MSDTKMCSPRCRDFKCVKNALSYRGSQAWCNWTNEPCDLKSCNYAACYKRRLLDNGICGLTIKRKTREDVEPEEFTVEEIRVRSKITRKIGEKTIF